MSNQTIKPEMINEMNKALDNSPIQIGNTGVLDVIEMLEDVTAGSYEAKQAIRRELQERNII